MTGSDDTLAEPDAGAVPRVRPSLATRRAGPALALVGARILLDLTLGTKPSDDVSASSSSSSVLRETVLSLARTSRDMIVTT
jgi:hypothetical protein